MPQRFSIILHSETQVSAVWACLGGNPLDMSKTPYRASEGRRSQSSTMPYHPHLHFISSIDYNNFKILQCHLNDHLCRKVTLSDNLLLLEHCSGLHITHIGSIE